MDCQQAAFPVPPPEGGHRYTTESLPCLGGGPLSPSTALLRRRLTHLSARKHPTLPLQLGKQPTLKPAPPTFKECKRMKKMIPGLLFPIYSPPVSAPKLQDTPRKRGEGKVDPPTTLPGPLSPTQEKECGSPLVPLSATGLVPSVQPISPTWGKFPAPTKN